MTQYEIVVGLEIHCQINTKTKMFCRCSNDSFNEAPNSNVCPVCMGFPGQLPVINQEAVKKGVIAGLALNCNIPRFSKFDRKNYFYPDSPKGFQISQYDKPVAENGQIIIETSEGEKTIGITRLHLEDDAGKLTHTAAGTLCDFNRAGTPLMEIVSEPDIRSIEEASAYAREIQKIMRYVNSSDADMEKGMMRFDLNISLRPQGTKPYGTKVEIKNLNSFQALEKAMEYEVKRQTKELEAGNSIPQETRGWNEVENKTISQRSKEEANDYRYFPEPDLPPLICEQDMVEALRQEFVGELPYQKRQRFQKEFQLSTEEIRILTETRAMADFFELANSIANNPKTVASFVTTILQKFLNEHEITLEETKVTAQHIGDLVKAIDSGTISNNTAKTTVFEAMFETGDLPDKIIEEKGLKQVSDTGLIEELCKKAIESNPKAIEDYKSGNEKALGALVGFIMKESKGQANPGLVNQTLKNLLD
jgi:aspartyl-tRNA(Asn)/glutamyl-tRNA(Gln) amidotransferase subunit B